MPEYVMTIHDEVDSMIAEIEGDKGRVRIEADDLKEDYHKGLWFKKQGMTKRQCEDRLMRLQGEVIGFERALSTLYRWKAQHPEVGEGPKRHLTDAQRATLEGLCERYHVPFNPNHYNPTFDLPDGWVAGWVGGPERYTTTIYVGVSPEGEASS